MRFFPELIASALRTQLVLDRQPHDLGMQLFDLSFCWAALLAGGEHIGHPIDSLPLQSADLVWVKLVLRRDLLHDFVATQRFQRHLGFKLIRKLPALRHSRITSKVWDTP